MAEGYVKLYRQLQEHGLWLEEPFTRGQAWVDLILMANHAKGQWFNGATYEEIERGCVITSEIKLSERWKWSRTKVRNYLEMLAKAKMIEVKKDTKKTYLKISQYCVWQDKETSKGHQKNNGRTSKGHQEDTNNNDKNDNNDKNKDEANKNSLLSKQTDCEQRRNDFGLSLKPFEAEYGKPLLQKFYTYWAERNKSGTKMRYEHEKTWELSMRLVTWQSNQGKWDKNDKQEDATNRKMKTATEILAEKALKNNINGGV